MSMNTGEVSGPTHRQTTSAAIVCLGLSLLATVARAKYGGGAGTPDDPYLVYAAEQMYAIGLDPNDWDKHFKLMADLDLSAYKGNTWHRIGVYSTARPHFNSRRD